MSQSQGGVYNQIINKKDFAEIPVKWNKWSGDDGTRVEYRLNGHAVLTQTLSGSGAQTGNGTLKVAKGGKYKLEVALCDDSACSVSVAKDIVVEDTDGSHMTGLALTQTGSHKPYTNSSNKVVGSYFVEWGVYGRNFPVDKIPAYNLTHILYGFIPICGPNESLRQMNPSGHGVLVQSCTGRPDYSVTIHDIDAALRKTQKGQGTGDTYKGNFGQLMALKQAYPDLKILPSVGGWSLSDPFYYLNDSAKRKVFVDSVADFLKTWKFFDGVDIDWEYPGGGGANPDLGDPVNGGQTYLLLMQELRAMLDGLTLETGRTYELTSAVGAARSKLEKIDYGAVTNVADYIFLMTYDFFGAFDLNTLGHMTGVHRPDFRPDSETIRDFNTQTALDIIAAQGANMSKVAVGTAMYGRGWTGVSGIAPGTLPFTGTATGPVKGSWEPGVVDYKDIAAYLSDPAWTQGYDTKAQAPYIFRSSGGDLISYDDPRSVKAKGALVNNRGLAGLFSWEIDGDNGDILNAMHEGLGHGGGSGNLAPVARAGQDSVISDLPSQVSLDGSQSADANGDVLTFNWTQTAGSPVVTLSNENTATASFNGPSVQTDTTLTFTLTVSDGTLSATDSVNVLLKAAVAGNTPPVVNAGLDQTVQSGATVTLNGSGSSDADGDNLTYQWQQTQGSTVTITQGDQVQAAFVAPVVSSNQTLTFSLTVNDGSASVTDSLTVSVQTDGGGHQCDLTDPAASQHPVWGAATAYATGAVVSYDNLVWKAAWWNQNSSPAINNAAWLLQSNVEFPWNADVAYNGGSEVNHNSRRFRAAHWTKGDTPGQAAVWSDIGPTTCQ